MVRRKPDTDIRSMARTLAKDSIVTEATARLLEQVMIEVNKRMEKIMQEAIAAEREACIKAIETIPWSAATAEGEWALREAAKVIANSVRSR